MRIVEVQRGHILNGQSSELRHQRDTYTFKMSHAEQHRVVLCLELDEPFAFVVLPRVEIVALVRGQRDRTIAGDAEVVMVGWAGVNPSLPSPQAPHFYQ